MLARNDFLDFFAIGTGPREAFWLRQSLSEHPSLAIAEPSKRRAFLGHKAQSGALSYRPDELSRWRANFRNAGPLTVLGAVDCDAMLDPNLASRLSQSFPQIKLIAFLRDPAELILDIYHAEASQGPVAPSLSTALADHPEWLDRARYHRHLLPFLDRFHPDQICLVIYERFFADEVANYQRLCTYLGVDSEFRPSPVLARPEGLSRAAGKLAIRRSRHLKARLFGHQDGEPQALVDDDTRIRIQDLLHGEMSRLENALGIDLDLWRGHRYEDANSVPQAENVIPLPAGAERRQRLAERRARLEAGVQ